jgi:Spy/CpxP family protein refolding chaperone
MLAVAAACLLSQTVAGQRVHLEPRNVSDHLFEPELVMRYQRHLELTDQQRTVIVNEVRELQAAVLQLQWQLEDQNQVLSELMAGDAIDVEAALQQLDRVMELEHQIKRNHFRYLIEIKNTLTADQQLRLRELRESDRVMHMDSESGMIEGAMREHMEGGMMLEMRERAMREHMTERAMRGEMREREMRERMREQGMRRRPEPANRL